jgi:TonB family protein
MMITLGGSSGPDTGGMTAIGGREVEKVAPPEPEKRVEPTPPAVPPKMTLPPEKPKPARKEEARRAPPEPAERPVTTGAQVTEGNTPVDTGVRGRGFGGLSSSGGNGPFSIKLDTGEFCCHEYLDAMLATIERNWRRNQGTTGATVMKFTILKSGRLDNIEIERTSGVGLLDLAAQRALDQTTLQPLPDRYTNPTLTVHITFQYWND